MINPTDPSTRMNTDYQTDEHGSDQATGQINQLIDPAINQRLMNR
jgi:hypothetical protein